MIDRSKLKQAATEFVYAFVGAFAVGWTALNAGTGALDNATPGGAAIKALILSSLIAAGKAVLWFLTGTKIPPEPQV